MFYKGITIDNCTHVPGPVAQSSDGSENNAVCIAGMALAYFRMLNNELLNKYPGLVPEQTHIIILDTKSAI